MDPTMIALLSLRALGLATGHNEIATRIDQLVGAFNAGKDIDDHMQAIADKLEAGEDLDTWDDIVDRIDAEVADFLDEPPPAA